MAWRGMVVRSRGRGRSADGKHQPRWIENPELAAERARELYRAKGYPNDWIEMRLKTIDIRNQLTNARRGSHQKYCHRR